MFRRKLKLGDMVYVGGAFTMPKHRRIFKVASIESSDGQVRLKHVVSGSELDALDADCELLPDKPDFSANCDCLVGRRLRVFLIDGNRMTGTCTGVMYHEVTMLDLSAKQVAQIELDGSQATSFGWSNISKIEAVNAR